ncbi:MAG: histidine kinase [Candidatus Aminicenantes bacterium]|nr:histidine kinase [Candidatus Aminicenantes bacterium]
MIYLKNRKNLFWILQTAGWLSYVGIILITFWVRGALTTFVLVRFSTAAAAGFLVTSAIRYFYKRINILNRPFRTLFLLTVLTSLVGTNLLIWISNVLRIPYLGLDALKTNPNFMSYLHRNVWWFTPLIGWNALYLSIKFWREWSVQKKKTEEAQSLAQAAQLQMLSYRLNPHFLFNALNSIRALIVEDKKNAKNMITELSDYLRYSLISRNHETVPLKDEMEAIQHFFNIQKMRYEKKLDVSIDVDPAAEEFPVPSFLLHPLAENAVKHGLRTSPLPLKIQVKVDLLRENLHIKVINTGYWIAPPSSSIKSPITTGLDNVRQRLQESYPGKHRFDISEKNGSVQADLTIKRSTGALFS